MTRPQISQWSLKPWTSTQTLHRATDPDLALSSSPGWRSPWLWVASRPPNAACPSPPLLLHFCLLPQHMNHSASLSPPFLHQVCAHHKGTYPPASTMSSSSPELECDDPGWPMGVFHMQEPSGTRWDCGSAFFNRRIIRYILKMVFLP